MGEKELILKQYEIIVNSANQVTSWRQTANKFYLTVNTTLLAITTLLSKTNPFTGIVTSLCGIAISILWGQNIDSYSKLNKAKFKVIHEIEKQLPVQMFKIEYDHYVKDERRDVSEIEKTIPWLFAIAYGVVLIASLYVIATR